MPRCKELKLCLMMIEDIPSIYTVAVALETGPDDRQNLYIIEEGSKCSPFLCMYDCMYLPTVPPNHKPHAKFRKEE